MLHWILKGCSISSQPFEPAEQHANLAQAALAAVLGLPSIGGIADQNEGLTGAPDLVGSILHCVAAQTRQSKTDPDKQQSEKKAARGSAFTEGRKLLLHFLFLGFHAFHAGGLSQGAARTCHATHAGHAFRCQQVKPERRHVLLQGGATAGAGSGLGFFFLPQAVRDHGDERAATRRECFILIPYR
ncbi:MAG: hypothetical protein M5R42_12670 [Rhodocyclaceae bacterium]|nr:hypothetical protein [Rhodocyclaceae bacterium]